MVIVAAFATAATPTIETTYTASAFRNAPGAYIRTGGNDGMPDPLVTPLSTPMIADACCGRASGFFARHCITSAVMAGGRSGRNPASCGGASPMCAPSTRAGVRPWKGGLPVTSSNAMQPSA